MEKKSNATPIASSILILICLLFVTLPILFMLLLTGKIHYVGLVIAVAIILFLLFVFYMFELFKTKKIKLIFTAGSLLVLCVASISPLKHAYIHSIATVDSEVDIFQYMPFTDNQGTVARLEEASTLKITGKLPRMDGATALYPLYSAIAQATYPEKEYYPYSSEVMVNTTPEAYSNLLKGEVDMIFVAAPSKSQQNYAKQLGLELKLTPIGKEAFVFFVNQKNSINGLTLDQIKDIYSGNVTNWKEVGGDNDAIRAFQRPEDSGSQTALQSLMGDIPLMDPPSEDVASGMGGIINEVSKYRNFKNAIGYTFRFYSNEMVKNKQIKLLEIDGVAPTKENIVNGTYPIASEFYIVTAGTTNPNVDKLIDWILSSQGQSLIEKAGYVPISSTDK